MCGVRNIFLLKQELEGDNVLNREQTLEKLQCHKVMDRNNIVGPRSYDKPIGCQQQYGNIKGHKDDNDPHKVQRQDPGSSLQGQEFFVLDFVGDPKDIEEGRHRKGHRHRHSTDGVFEFGDADGFVLDGHDRRPRGDRCHEPTGKQSYQKIDDSHLDHDFPTGGRFRPSPVVGIQDQVVDFFRNRRVDVQIGKVVECKMEAHPGTKERWHLPIASGFREQRKAEDSVAEGIRKDGKDNVEIEGELSRLQDCHHEEDSHQAHHRAKESNDVEQRRPPCFQITHGTVLVCFGLVWFGLSHDERHLPRPSMCS